MFVAASGGIENEARSTLNSKTKHPYPVIPVGFKFEVGKAYLIPETLWVTSDCDFHAIFCKSSIFLSKSPFFRPLDDCITDTFLSFALKCLRGKLLLISPIPKM